MFSEGRCRDTALASTQAPVSVLLDEPTTDLVPCFPAVV